MSPSDSLLNEIAQGIAPSLDHSEVPSGRTESHAEKSVGHAPATTDKYGWCLICGHGNDSQGKVHLLDCPAIAKAGEQS